LPWVDSETENQEAAERDVFGTDTIACSVDCIHRSYVCKDAVKGGWGTAPFLKYLAKGLVALLESLTHGWHYQRPQDLCLKVLIKNTKGVFPLCSFFEQRCL